MSECGSWIVCQRVEVGADEDDLVGRFVHSLGEI